jgi:hypothetical protein
MSFTLGDEDRRAVDMLLDRDGARANGNGNGGDGNGGGHASTAAAAAQGGRFHQRIQRVEQILSLLSNLPASDPPQNLAARVMERLAEEPPAGARRAPVAPSQPTIDATRPLA